MRGVLIVKLIGGLGNQLFIIAAAIDIARRYNKKILVDVTSYKNEKFSRTYDLNNFIIGDSLRVVGQSLLSRISVFLLKKLLLMGRSFDEKNFSYRINKSILPQYLEGYWQSEKYFAESANLIRESYTFIPAYLKIKFEKILSEQKATYVAVHYRSYKELEGAGDHLSDLYYKRAADIIEKRFKNITYVLFSDDDTWLNDIKFTNEKIIQIGEKDMSDIDALYLMSKCSHFIVANSTYSWWGAWLSDTENKLIILPDIPRPEYSDRNMKSSSNIEIIKVSPS